MKWTNGYSAEEKYNRKSNWHKYFAWFPVVVGLTSDNREIKVWWEWVERKGEITYATFPDWYFYYREIK